MSDEDELIESCASLSDSRFDFWGRFIQAMNINVCAELGVFRGEFSQEILKACPSIEKYYMIDPWRHLDSWNKPANVEDDIFESYYLETKSRTKFASNKRFILRGKTTEVIDKIAENELDFAYVDGDHTLKGISIDLIRLFPKIKDGGWIGGDDFSKTVWQHPTTFEPTLVFPFAVYFAEAVNARIYGLPKAQFLIKKDSKQPFAFIDLTSSYGEPNLRSQFHPDEILRLKLRELSIIQKGKKFLKKLCS